MKILLIITLILFTIKSKETTDTGETSVEKTEEPTTSSAAPVDAAKTKKCNLTVIKELGLKGIENVKNTSLFMCPSIKSTCCDKDDQIELYNNWITKKESHNLKERFEYHESIYFKFLDAIEKVYGRAVKLMKELRENNVEISDCKIISRRIVHYQLPNIIPVLKTLIKKMHHFYRKTYKGVYCAVCDGESNGFINEGAMEVDFSKKFCRDIVKHSLGVLIYFHTHIPRLTNLMSKFLITCNNEGVYTAGGVPPDFFFHINPEVSKTIEDCKEFRNDSNWFEYCGKVCHNFNMVEFNKFFQPNLDEFAKYETFLKENIARLDNEGKEPEDGKEAEKTEKKSKKTNKGARVLEEKAEKTEETEETEKTDKKESENNEEKTDENPKKDQTEKKKEEPELTPAERFADLNLFIIKEGSPIINIKPTFRDKGISLYDLGEAAEITEKTLELAKTQDSPAPIQEEAEPTAVEGAKEGAASNVGKEGAKVEEITAEKTASAVEGVMIFEAYVVFFLYCVFG